MKLSAKAEYACLAVLEPREISVCDIVQIVEGPTASTVAEQDANSSPGWRVLRKVWHDTNCIESEHLRQIDFAHLAELACAQNANIYYI